MRFIILISALLMQICLGATYSWSVFVQPLKDLLELQQGPAQLPFTTFYFMFPLTMIFAGYILPKIGPRISAVIGGIFFGSGWLLASQGIHSFIYTVMGIGVLSGIGAGFAYIVPIAVCIQWFPKSKGLVTGIAVAGFGGGAALVSQISGYLMESLGKTPFETFSLFGVLFLVVTCTAGSTMSFPKTYSSKINENKLHLIEIIKHPVFIVLYSAMFVGLAAGFAVNANLKELFIDSTEAAKVGVTAVSLFALANAAGRILWGMFFDRVKSTTAIQANLMSQAVILCLSPILLTSTSGFFLFAFLTGLNYGGVLVLYVSTASRYWGAEKVSQVYSILFSSNILASFSPILAGSIFDIFQSFDFAMYGLAAMLVIGTLFIRQKAEIINAD